MTILGKNITQGSVATHLRCGGIFNNHFTTNFLKNPSVKEFWKCVKIWQSYRYEFDAPFLRHSVEDMNKPKPCLNTVKRRLHAHTCRPTAYLYNPQAGVTRPDRSSFWRSTADKVDREPTSAKSMAWLVGSAGRQCRQPRTRTDMLTDKITSKWRPTLSCGAVLHDASETVIFTDCEGHQSDVYCSWWKRAKNTSVRNKWYSTAGRNRPLENVIKLQQAGRRLG